MERELAGAVNAQEEIVRYYLLRSAPEEALECYGIEVEYRGEVVEFQGLSGSLREIRSLLETLIRCSVTPVTLPYIVEDWLFT